MGVESKRLVEYIITCDNCGIVKQGLYSANEDVHSKQDALKWNNMHKIKDGKIFCEECYKKYKGLK